MNQREAVLKVMTELGGQATLAQLYQHALRVPGCQWGSKTLFASIRRIVQTSPLFVKLQPGLWALADRPANTAIISDPAITHSYYQGVLLALGNLRGFSTFSPQQDKNKLFLQQPLHQVRSLTTLPEFCYPDIRRAAETVDVIWFNQRHMPNAFFEVEHSTNFQNAVVKFGELQDFYASFVLVADAVRQAEYEQKLNQRLLAPMRSRVRFMSYTLLIRQYEYETFKQQQSFTLL